MILIHVMKLSLISFQEIENSCHVGIDDELMSSYEWCCTDLQPFQKLQSPL